jgi:hypothetical protein
MDPEEIEDRISDDDHDSDGQLDDGVDDAVVVVPDEATARAGAGDGQDGPVPKKTRKERQAQRKRDHEDRIRADARADADARIAELTGQLANATARLTENSNHMLQVVDRIGKPPEKPLTERARERVLDAAKKIRGDDPATVEEFLRVSSETNSEVAQHLAREIVQEEMKKFRAELPRGPSPQDAPYYQMAPWLNDPDMKQAVQLEVGRLARGGDGRGTRDVRNQRVYDATVKEALVKVGREWGRDISSIPGGERQKPNAAVMGSGARGGSASGGGDGDGEMYTPFMKELADGDSYYRKKYKDPKARYHAYYVDNVLPTVKKRQAGG